jgi:hypothetical protein
VTLAVRTLVLAAALMALALTTAASLAGQNARARMEPAATEALSPTRERTQAGRAGGVEAEISPRAASRVKARRSASAARGGRAAPARSSGPSRRISSAPARASLMRVRPGRSVAVRARPGGRVIGRLDSRTEFGSPQVLGAVKTDGRWLGVATTTRSNGRLAWVDARSSALRAAPAKVSIRADLSRRRIELWRGEKVTERVSVAIGRPGSSTPTGRFTVTDKLDGRKFSPYYGCCVLALSGTQPNLPAGWSGGNRLAIHGTNDPGSIGQASSAGCLRAANSDLRKLMRRVSLGTPVEIRR